MDVAFAGCVFEDRAVKRKRSDGGGGGIGEANANGAANHGDDQRLSQELQLDLPPPGAQSATQTNLPDAFFHGHQHDVHQPHAANAKRERSNEREQGLEANGDAIDDGPELLSAEHHDGALIRG
jgi:hypothetical protein